MMLLQLRKRIGAGRRSKQPLTVTGLTLEHVASGLRYRLSWSHARMLAEAFHSTLDGPVQVAAAGWIVRREGARWELDGTRFDFPIVRLTRAQAVYVGDALARVQRMGVA